MVAYATVEDVEARWRPLSDEEKNRAVVLLADAAVRLDAECALPEVPTSQQIAARLIVSCEMVKRAMVAGDAMPGVETIQEGAGPFQTSFKYSNPTGDLYLTKADRKLLGCGAQAAFTVSMSRPVDVEVYPWITSTL